ncbi:MAG: gamma-glutamyltransferase [Acidobacteria bacterium]|nr:gamma-glutamyltransferase [Acidobacteriota bacterium]
MKRFVALFALLLLWVGCGKPHSESAGTPAASSLVTGKDVKKVYRFPINDPAMGRRGAVASSHPLATEAGMRILAQGGNAVDAAVATAAALGVVQPEMSGLGATGAMNLYIAATGELITLDYWGTTPSLVYPERMNEETKEAGILAALVPGAVAGWAEAVKKYGKLSLATVLQPAIEYAENGFPVDNELSNFIRTSSEIDVRADRWPFQRSKFRRFQTSARIFLPGGRVLAPGEILVQKDLARTLKKIAAQGPDVFYRGEIADAFVKFSQENNGFFTKEDFARYQARWEKPSSISYRGYQIYASPAPSSGPTALQTLKILEGYDLKSMGRFSADLIHVFSEASKLASADEMAYLGDPAFVPDFTARLISQEHAEEQRKRISMQKAAVRVPAASIAERGGNTTAFATADGTGNVVSVIQTLLRGFGCGVVFGDTGVLFNNGMRLFRSNGPNNFQPGKRLRHPVAPMLITREGKPVLALGAAGAETIWQTQAQTIISVIDYGMNIQEAISAPRAAIAYAYNAVKDGLKYVEDFTYGEISAEEGYLDPGVVRELKGRGHSIQSAEIGSVQGIQIDPVTKVLRGGADPREGGRASAW